MSRIQEPAPLGHGFVEKPYTQCKFCEADLDPNETMMYYCDTKCYFSQNITGPSIQTHCEHKETFYSLKHDAVACFDCHAWLEKACEEKDCEACADRPKTAKGCY